MNVSITAGLLSLLLVAAGSRSSEAASRVPVFQSESVQEFMIALQRDPHRTVESRRHDYAGYRAYRFLDRDMVLVGVASAVFVDERGRLHIVQAHGEPMGGHPNATREEYSHILVPVSVVLPRE